MNIAQKIYKDEIQKFVQILVTSIIFLGLILGPLTEVALLL